MNYGSSASCFTVKKRWGIGEIMGYITSAKLMRSTKSIGMAYGCPKKWTKHRMWWICVSLANTEFWMQKCDETESNHSFCCISAIDLLWAPYKYAVLHENVDSPTELCKKTIHFHMLQYMLIRQQARACCGHDDLWERTNLFILLYKFIILHQRVYYCMCVRCTCTCARDASTN